MNSHKTENNIGQFEKRISNTIIVLGIIALLITTVLFSIISYQGFIQRKSIKSKDIDVAINLFQYNFSEKLSIIASSNVFIDFFTSGVSTRNDLEARFLIEILPLRSSGVVGYSLINSETGTDYQSGQQSEKSLTVNLCYLGNRLDSENGNCYGYLKLFFSKDKIDKELMRINQSIKPCKSCEKYNLTKNGYFGNFLVANQSGFYVNITTDVKAENIVSYYLIVVIMLFSFVLFNRIKLRKIVKGAISNPIELLVQKIKSQELLVENTEALHEINYLSSQIEAGRLKVNKIKEYEKQAAIGHLSASVAHDIRSPLAVIEVIMSMISSSVPREQLSLLNQAVQSVRDIANNLLEKYRHHHQESNALNGNASLGHPVLLCSLIEQVISQKRYEWLNITCELTFDFEQEVRFIWINVVPGDTKRMISNLLNNAIEACEKDPRIQIQLNKANNLLELRISDNGLGISSENMEYFMEGGSSKHVGRGMGLSGAKQYMESLGGKLTLTSGVNNGAVVKLYFPIFNL
ncbi:MAG: HAMP domain-containing sensor histidine kinase [Gammaproteobacteria bacterium]